MNCMRFACGLALDLLVICEGFAPPASAHAAQAQAHAKASLVICLRFAYGFDLDLFECLEGFDPPSPVQATQAQA